MLIPNSTIRPRCGGRGLAFQRSRANRNMPQSAKIAARGLAFQRLRANRNRNRARTSLLRGLAFQRSRANRNSEGFGKSRSAEHTSELQSLMRISYAVFCLKKKTTINQRTER